MRKRKRKHKKIANIFRYIRNYIKDLTMPSLMYSEVIEILHLLIQHNVLTAQNEYVLLMGSKNKCQYIPLEELAADITEEPETQRRLVIILNNIGVDVSKYLYSL